MPDPVVQLLRGASEYSFTLIEALFGLWRPATPSAASPDAVELKRRAQETLWRLQSEYQRVAGEPRSLDNLIELADLLPSAEEFRDAAVAWLDLVETLVQTAEREYGAAPGKGAYKAEQVKAILLGLLIDQKWNMPDLPAFLEPIVVESVVNWTIDSVVLVLNRNKIWDTSAAAPTNLPLSTRVLRFIQVALRRFFAWAPIARLSLWLQRLVRRAVLAGHPLSPSLRAAVEEIRQKHFPDVDTVVERAAKIAAWVAAHRQQVTALVELVSFATQEAEAFANFTGPQKKEYARDIIVAFLEELQIVGEDSVWEAMVERFIDWGIDGIVLVFNKRKLFQHRPAASAA